MKPHYKLARLRAKKYIADKRNTYSKILLGLLPAEWLTLSDAELKAINDTLSQACSTKLLLGYEEIENLGKSACDAVLGNCSTCFLTEQQKAGFHTSSKYIPLPKIVSADGISWTVLDLEDTNYSARSSIVKMFISHPSMLTNLYSKTDKK